MIENLQTLSRDFSLTINKKKSAIMLVKGHELIKEKEDILGIPIVENYNYLRVLINKHGDLGGQLDRISQRCNYLRANMKYYAQNFKF